MRDVVLDFGLVRVTGFDLVRREVAVRDGVVVTWARFVDVLRGQRRHKNEERPGNEQGGGAGQRPNHAWNY